MAEQETATIEEGARERRIFFHPVTWGVLFTIVLFLFAIFLGRTEHCFHENGCISNFEIFLESTPNEIGDTLAGFAGALAFVWIIVTVWLQSIELSEQRKELREQKEATQAMAKTMARQNFDSFVFELITTLNTIVGSMDIQSNDKRKTIYRGRDCFRFFYTKIGKVPPEEKMYPEMLEKDPIVERYQEVYQEHHSDLGHYFRFVYNMLRVVAASEEVELRHKKIIRALFSDDELLVLFYNCLTDQGRELIAYAESFELFDNLPVERLVRAEHKQRLSPKCFGERA